MQDYIHVYGKEEAVNDGILVDLCEVFTKEVHDAGINIPLYCTRSVYENYIALTEKAKKALNDEHGRAWDLIFMSRPALKKTFQTYEPSYFQFLCVVDRITPKKCRCKAVFDGEAFTILEIDED